MMNKKRFHINKRVLIVVIVVSTLFVGYLFYIRLAFNGYFYKRYSKEKLVQNFINNEKSFSELVEYFNGILPKDNNQSVAFGIGKGNTVKLYIYPIVVDPANKVLGAGNLKFNSKELDSLLVRLKWTNENAIILREKLLETNCDWIKTTEVYGNPIQVYPQQDGWGSYCYYIFNIPISDELKDIHGKPISESIFGRRVFLEYSSAL